MNIGFQPPDLNTLIVRIAGDIEAQLPGTDARLRRNLLAIVGRALAGAAHGLYGHLDWIAEQVFPDSADADHLARWATIWGVARKAASAAAGSITFTGTVAAAIPTGTRVARSDGVEFSTDADATIDAGGSVDVAATAVVAGAADNTDAGLTLTLVSPVAGVNTTATVGAAGLTGGADTEADGALRARLLARIQTPPGGGTADDYGRWTLEVPGVTRAWVFPGELGAGTVTVRFVNDDDPNSIIPPQATVDAVQAYLDGLRPITAAVTAVAPVAAPLAMTISITPSNTTTQTAVTAELRDLFVREAAPGATIVLSHLNEAIAIAAGVTDHSLVAPVADVTHTNGQMPMLGTITWQ